MYLDHRIESSFRQVQYGLNKLKASIERRGLRVQMGAVPEETDASYVIVARLADDPQLAAIITEAGLKRPAQPEALAILHTQSEGRQFVYLCGADPTGLMYAALDAAAGIQRAADNRHLFDPIKNSAESPFLADRSISTYTMQRRWFEQRLHDPSYWEQYFDMLAHQRGIRLTLGIWDHIYRGGVQGGGIEGASDLVGKRSPHLVYGVTAENLAAYTKAALKKMLTVFPDIDGLQFRMHGESGLTREEIPPFWHKVFKMLHSLNPNIRFDLRAKGLPDEVIEDASRRLV